MSHFNFETNPASRATLKEALEVFVTLIGRPSGLSGGWGGGELKGGDPREQLAGCGICAMAESGRLIQKASIRHSSNSAKFF